MKAWKSLALTLLVSSTSWATNQSIFEEKIYYQYQDKILNSPKSAPHAAFAPFEQKLYVDALWDLVEDEEPRALKALSKLDMIHYELAERLRIGILQVQSKVKHSLSPQLIKELSNHLLLPQPETKVIYLVASYQDLLNKAGHKDIVGLASQFEEFHNLKRQSIRSKSDIERIAIDLFYNSPNISYYQNGKYEGGVKLFMFCRQNRNYPCLFAMRDANDNVVRNKDGSIWTQRSLAQSARKLPYNVRNGYTPTGVWTIDGVMPYADQTISFGRFRRMIINFIPKTNNESALKSLIPESSHDENWWKQSIVARDVGRNLFRIHGTGKTNPDPKSTFYPFRETSGCISQRENVHDGYDWIDQRKLLDKIMVAQGHKATYANETKIKGILYFMEIDNKNAPVEKSDLAKLGIK
ncbi:MAG: hypothetical protein WCY48_03580 [Candidatus Caldatribacteriota bacterium]